MRSAKQLKAIENRLAAKNRNSIVVCSVCSVSHQHYNKSVHIKSATHIKALNPLMTEEELLELGLIVRIPPKVNLKLREECLRCNSFYLKSNKSNHYASLKHKNKVIIELV